MYWQGNGSLTSVLSHVEAAVSYKEKEHLPDVAFQVYVLQEVGLNVTQASLMHLNGDCRAPDLSDLFALTDFIHQFSDRIFDYFAGVVAVSSMGVVGTALCQRQEKCKLAALAESGTFRPNLAAMGLYQMAGNGQANAAAAAGPRP